MEDWQKTAVVVALFTIVWDLILLVLMLPLILIGALT